ncbi:hypothetical protein EDD22DRAFT_852087 [Suillus occidentalis]|nr:hypothetical protein EDD22DRAFT_852087 [Suillus occidentalis]
MAGFPANSLRLTAVISGQIIILAFAYGFLEAVLHFAYIALPNQVDLWRLYPEELTMVVILIATVISVATTMWTIILTPTYFLWPIQLNGSELDMSGSAFSALLHERDNSFEVIDIGSMLSGVAAAGYTFGVPKIFKFQRSKIQHIHSGDCAHDQRVFRLEWSPGYQWYSSWFLRWKRYNQHDRDTAKTRSLVCSSRLWHELFHVAAGTDSRCRLRAHQLESTPFHYGSSPMEYQCKLVSLLRTPVTQEYVTMVDASGNGSSSGSGFLPSVICPGPMTINQTYTSFLIFTQGFDKYNFLNASVCEVIQKLPSFIAGVAKYQANNSQGLVSSTIGDTLYSTYTSMTNGSINGTIDQMDVYLELEEYRRGVVEFSATFLRSGFMAMGSFSEQPLFPSQWYNAWKYGNQRLTFDASNTLHLIMAAGGPSLELAGFDQRGILANEGVEVRLYECEMLDQMSYLASKLSVQAFMSVAGITGTESKDVEVQRSFESWSIVVHSIIPVLGFYLFQLLLVPKHLIPRHLTEVEKSLEDANRL